ncbi:MAG: beta-1,6-N-acetylglucosaminyltransferase [Chthoniobacteraceae bacterium]
MGLAYCILAHKNPAQTARLIRALEGPGNVFLVHYEKRAPQAEHRELARLCEAIPGVRFLKPQRIFWGRFSVIGVQLEAIRQALDTGDAWTHLITLSGQDFPLRSQAAIQADLASTPAQSFVSWFDPVANRLWKNLDDRIGRYYFECAPLEDFLQFPFIGRRVRGLLGWRGQIPSVPGIRRRVPEWFHYRGGSNHVILSREAARYIVGDPRALRITGWLRHSGIPDESLFQSILLNSPLASTVVNDDRRAILWKQLGDPSPSTLTAADLPWINEQRAQGRLFARKFDAAVDVSVLNTLEQEL